jgi:acyl-CoA-binding protein
MHIYKFTHKETSRCYIGQTIQDPNKGGTSLLKGRMKGKTWEEIYGKEKADEMRELRRLRDLSKT